MYALNLIQSLFCKNNGKRPAPRLSKIEDFHLEAPLGKGAFGHVVRATDSNGNAVAMKFMSKEYIVKARDAQRKIENELMTLREIPSSHPLLVGARSVIVDATRVVVVMDYVQGGDLMSTLEQRDVLTDSETSFIFQEISKALDFLHKVLGLMHRDLKPDNVLLTPDGKVKLADFGLASILHPNQALATACGTPGYVAPEIIGAAGYEASMGAERFG